MFDNPDHPILSIVIPTFNRIDRLRRCLDKIRQNVATAAEVVVIDGGSTDGTRQWLTCRKDLRVVLEEKREGAVRAFNKGFRAATGRFVMWLNDDAYPMPGAVEAAIEMIQRDDIPDLGMVAFYHNWAGEHNVLDRVSHEGESYELCHVRGYPYANFGLLRRDLLERIGFADERFYFFGFDPDLSLRIQIDEGLKVLGCREALIHHDQYHDERKLGDLPVGEDDNVKLFAKWNLPLPGTYPDPRRAYLKTLMELGLVRTTCA